MTLSIIIPTCGRSSLRRTLLSLVPQLLEGDQVLVIGDGEQPNSAIICQEFGVCYVDGVETGCFGNRQRQAGMALATGDYLLFIDDDDVYVPQALSVVRLAIAEHPDRPMLFQFIDKNGAVIWQQQEVKEGNISTAQIVFPNRSTQLGVWQDRYEGDFDFVRSTLDKWPGGDQAVVWRPNILVDCRRASA
jgi:glycosyltransferase involved in cell wall biosynthesis